MTSKSSISYPEVWRIIRELESDGIAYGRSILRDTVNHYYEIRHPGMLVIVDRVYYSEAKYSVVNAEEYFYNTSNKIKIGG